LPLPAKSQNALVLPPARLEISREGTMDNKKSYTNVDSVSGKIGSPDKHSSDWGGFTRELQQRIDKASEEANRRSDEVEDCFEDFPLESDG
jgi:hypothetical protein